MRIKFKSSDPRAGMVAQMDSYRGQALIDAGAAIKVKDDGSDEATAPAPTPAPTAAPAPAPTSAPAPAAEKPTAKTTAKAKK